jgi:hypothetical protein
MVLNAYANSTLDERLLAFNLNSSTSRLKYFDSFGLLISMYTGVHAPAKWWDVLSICVRASAHGMTRSASVTVHAHLYADGLYSRARHTNASPGQLAHYVTVSSNLSLHARNRRVTDRLRTNASAQLWCASQRFGTPSNLRAVTRLSQSTCSRNHRCFGLPICVRTYARWFASTLCNKRSHAFRIRRLYWQMGQANA